MSTQDLKKERHNLENAAAQLLNFALKAGATTAEVCGGYGQKTRISLEKQDYHLASSDEGYSFGVRVLNGQRQGFASCNTLEAKDLKEVALRAVEIAGFSPENPNYGILPTGNVSSEAPSDLWDDSLYSLSLQTQKEWTKLMVAEALKDSRFRLNEGSLEIGSGIFLVTNSHGTHQIQNETAASWSVMGMGVEGEKITSFDYFSEMSRKKATVLEKLVHSTRSFRERVLSNLVQGPATSYKGLVLFTPRAALDILVSELLYHFNGRTIAEGISRWKREDIDKKVLESNLTFSDDPWIADRAGCSVFDREGTPTQRRVLMEKGHLRSLLLDNYAAKALGLTSTGNAGGGPSAIPTVTTHNLTVAGGKETLKNLVKRASDEQKTILVVHRYSGQVDPVTGDFSGVAKGGEWWENGERRHCVKETLISGNLFEALGSSLVGISAETEVIDAGYSSPWMLINNISVTAG